MQYTASEGDEPARFDHRFIRKVVELSEAKAAVLTEKDYDLISRVFHRRHGSWEGILKGNPDDVMLLKSIVKFGLKHGYITKG